MDDEILVSYDVKSLFTSIPVEESICICEQRLKADQSLSKRTELRVETIIQLLRFCLTSTAFQYENKHYQQLNGVAMGSPVSPVITDIFTDELENTALLSFHSMPRLFHRLSTTSLPWLREQTRKTSSYI